MAVCELHRSFIFTEVLRNDPGLTMKIIRMCVPDLEITEIVDLDREVTQQVSTFEKAGRLDVRVRLKDGRLVLIELQLRKQAWFVRRIRFYQSEADVESLEQGDEEYSLPDIIQISICDFDPVGEGKYIYDFEYRDREDSTVRMKDGTRKVFLNIRGERGQVSEEQKAFLDYLGGLETDDGLCGEIDDSVGRIKYNETRRRNFMKMKDYLYEERKAAREEGHAEGFTEGRAEGRAEGWDEAIRMMVLYKLEKGFSPEEIAGIDGTDIETVKKIAEEFLKSA